MFNFKFPYTNLHNLNLDWIVAEIKSILSDIKTIKSDIALLGGGDGIPDLIDQVYPVGCVYTSINETSPAELFGGTWEPLKDMFLLGAGDTYAAGATGGEAQHKLVLAELPEMKTQAYWDTGSNWGNIDLAPAWSMIFQTESLQQAGENGQEGNFTITYPSRILGGGLAHNNMPPYLTVYMWKRVS